MKMASQVFSIKAMIIVSLCLRLTAEARPSFTPRNQVSHMAHSELVSNSPTFDADSLADIPVTSSSAIHELDDTTAEVDTGTIVEQPTTSWPLSSSTLASKTAYMSRGPTKVLAASSVPHGMLSLNPPFWVNPCGTSSRKGSGNTNSNKDTALYAQTLYVATDIALTNANSFRDAYIRTAFGVDSFEEFAADWAHVELDWLPTYEVILKELGEILTSSYLVTLQFDVIVSTGFTAMQQYSVGLEQLLKDKNYYEDPFTGNFFNLTLDVKSEVLCTLSWAIDGMGIVQPVDVGRNVMPDNQRNVQDSSMRDMRDFIIFRDLINALEYYKQVSQYFVTKKAML